MRVICFDFDGVIVDSFSRLLDFAREVQKTLGSGRQPVREDFTRIKNLTFEDVGRAIGIDERSIEVFAAEMFARQQSSTTVAPMVSGMTTLFQEVVRFASIYIVSSGAQSEIERALKEYKLDTCVTGIFHGEMNGTKADKILVALSKEHAATDDGFMVGDARSDISAGQKAGVRTVAVTWGYQDRDVLIEEQPDFIVDTTDELLEVLKK